MSMFATKNTTNDQIKTLIKAVTEEKLSWEAASEKAGINYSRGWLIVRRHELENHYPELVVDVPTYLAARQAANLSAGIDHDAELELSRMVRGLRDDEQCSWGEIMVRMAMTEGRIRKLYEYSGKRSVGLRVGKGGRYVADRGDLYTGKRVKEGAHIPVGVSARVIDPSQLLNADVAEAAPKVKAVRKPRKLSATTTK